MLPVLTTYREVLWPKFAAAAATAALNLKINPQQLKPQEMFFFRENLCPAAGGLKATGEITKAYGTTKKKALVTWGMPDGHAAGLQGQVLVVVISLSKRLG